MKAIDLFIGVRAEQNLRDAVRDASERDDTDTGPALCPVGRKDWIAGFRLSGPVRFGEIRPLVRRLLEQLIELKSQQRIRAESVRVFSVQPPVPVFKDVEPVEEEAPAEEPAQLDGTVSCPVCDRKVHAYNVQRDPNGRIVGCFLCHGEDQGPFR